MRFLRFALVATLAAAASALVAVPASAQVPPIVHPVPPNLLQIFYCPKDGAITLFKTADKTDYNVGDIVTFTLRARADYCDTTGVKVHDQLPTGLTVSDPTVLDHDFGAIAAGTDRSFSFKAVAVAKGTWTNKAQAAGDSVGDTNPSPYCGLVIYSKVVSSNSNTVLPIRVIPTPTPPPTYTCPKTAAAEVTINVTAPSGHTDPTPTPAPPAGNPGVPQLPNTGRQA